MAVLGKALVLLAPSSVGKKELSRAQPTPGLPSSPQGWGPCVYLFCSTLYSQYIKHFHYLK